MTHCPFCDVAFDASGQHRCAALQPPPQQQGVIPQQAPAKSELERTIEVLAWAHEKGALHFKCPWFEIVFPPDGLKDTKHAPSDTMADNARAEAELGKGPTMYKSPIDDPDYYASAQDNFFNHQPPPTRR